MTSAPDRFVLVTGASTGIGRAIAEGAAQRGFRVFAGVRRAADADAVRGPRVQPVLLEVTSDDSVRAAVTEVAAACGPAGLHGLVNNAGIALAATVEHVPLDTLREQFEVNFFGIVRVTQACLPLLKRARGRIVMISSQNGRIALPLLGPYCASKFALEGLSDALRLEVAPLGVKVSLIEPGAVATSIWDRSRARAQCLRAAMPDSAQREYARLIGAFAAKVDKAEARGISAAECAAPVIEALESRKPRVRVPVGPDARRNLFLRRWISDRRLDRIVSGSLGWR
jgi:NAD(P)-dependent dehydrogenase (short-subunit alcohol dehydrogenase family)